MSLACCLSLPLPRRQKRLSEKASQALGSQPDQSHKAESKLSQCSTLTAQNQPSGEKTTAEDIIADVKRLESQYSHIHGGGRLRPAVMQLVRFFHKFAPSIDVIVQAGGCRVPQLIWGSLRAVLIIAESSIAYFQFVTSAVSEMAEILSICNDFEEMYKSEASVDKTISDVYVGVKCFLSHMQREMQKNSCKRLLKNICSSFQDEFHDDICDLDKRTKAMRDRVQITHMKKVETSHGQLQRSMSQAVENSETLVAQAKKNPEKALWVAGLLEWLSPVSQDEWLQHAIKRRASGTCKWIFAEERYRTWTRGSTGPAPAVMSVYGRPGSGKTVLAATIIAKLEKQVAPVTYHFSSSGNKAQTGTDACATIISQLLSQCPDTLKIVERAYRSAQKYGRQKRSERDSLPLLLKEVATSLPLVYCVLDGIDEYADPVGVIESFIDIARSVPSFRLLYCSRPVQPADRVANPSLTLHLDKEMVQGDIELYLENALASQPWDSESRHKAYETLSSASHGMFLYASLGIEALISAAVDPRSFEKTLRCPPKGIEGLYTKVLSRLAFQTEERSRLAWELIRWVCFSERPLTWAELQFALSWDEEKSAFCTDRQPFRGVIMDLCCPLIECHQEKFFPIHYSFKEFVRTSFSNEGLSFPRMPCSLMSPLSAHTSIAKRILACLSCPGVIEQVHIDAKAHPFEDYSTTYWCLHVSEADFTDDSLRLKEQAFMAYPQHRRAWILRYIIRNRGSFPLHRLIGLQKLVRQKTGTKSSNESLVSIDDLNDLQQVLLELDHLPSGAPISNFEKLLYVRDLVRAYTAVGGVSNGIEAFTAALDASFAAFGPDCLQSAWILNSLGLLYDQQHETEKAIETQHRALAIQQKHLGNDHLDLIGTINELGRLYRHLGHYEQSMDCHMRALAALRSIPLPDTDLQVIWTRNTMARCLQKKGSATEALALHEKALTGQRQALGTADHPHPIWTLGDIARCLRDLGRLDDAVATLREALARRERVLGPSHPDTLWTLNDIGLLYEALGQTDSALEVHERALRGQEEVLGPQHRHTVWSAEKVQVLRGRKGSD